MDAARQEPLVIMDPEVNSTFFACDLLQCKGACCTLPGGAGAPVTVEECEEIRNALPAALPYLNARSRGIIERHGYVDTQGDALRCIDDRDCVFVIREEGIAKCALEKAWNAGESSFRKPISCHLFPIRRTSGIYDHLRVERFPECEAGYARGEREHIPLITFARDALVRAYGEEWFATIDPDNQP